MINIVFYIFAFVYVIAYFLGSEYDLPVKALESFSSRFILFSMSSLLMAMGVHYLFVIPLIGAIVTSICIGSGFVMGSMAFNISNRTKKR